MASYYGISPLEVENWKTSQVDEWLSAACALEKMKDEAAKKAGDGQKS